MIDNFAASLAAQDDNRAQARALRERIEASPGGVAAFRQRVVVEQIVTDDEYAELSASAVAVDRAEPSAAVADAVGGRLQRFYAPYEACFPLEEERESFEGFRDIQLEGNFDGEMKAAIGPYREYMISLLDPDTASALGGANFTVYLQPQGVPTVHSTYVFLLPAYRDLGLGRALMAIRDQLAIRFLDSVDPGCLTREGGFYVFAEQNIPELTDALSYARDSAAAIDQVERLRKWSHLGYSQLQFEYLQPPLEAGGEPCEILSLNSYFRATLGEGAHTLDEIRRPAAVPAATVYRHLRAFFLQSVCKDVDAEVRDDTARKVLTGLRDKAERSESIATRPYADTLEYFAYWQERVKTLQRTLGATALRGDVTIAELAGKHEATTTR